MESESGRIARFKHDEYTGENRCIPCTVVNLCLAFLLALAFQTATILRDVPELALPGSTVIFAVSLAAIYFRGYLVPGTPTLTRRYFPNWLLTAFGKGQRPTGFTGKEEPDDSRSIDVEGALVDADVLTEAADGEDLRLTAEFERAFDERVAAVRSDEATREQLLEVLDVSRGDVEFEEFGSAFRVHRDGTLIGTWESRAAFLGDVAGAELLSDRVDGWEATSVRQRGELLNGLRLFLTTCPGCGGPLSFGTDTVESCCSTREVAAVTCNDCDSRVFESSAVA